MARFIGVLCVIVLVIAAFGWYRGWFVFGTSQAGDKTNINISVDKVGDMYVQKTQVNLGQLHLILSNKFRVNTNLPVYISGDKDATHGSVIRVLDIVRREGIQKVSFAITPAPENK